MTTPGRLGIALAFVFLLGGPTRLNSQTAPKAPGPVASSISDADKTEFQSFSERAYAYIKMTRALPPGKLSPKSNAQELADKRSVLRATIQQARPDAKQGEMFTPASAIVFRKVLLRIFNRASGPKVEASLGHAEPTPTQDLKVNAAYPNAEGQPLQSTPPTLLLNLPMLPKGLEYRISGHTLALRDTDANMVVDFLPNALP